MRVFVVAGEPSGDRLGAGLMAGLMASQKVKFEGIGGPLMAAQGLRSRVAMEQLSVIGLAEVIPALPRIFRILRETVEAVIAMRPDLLITIDSPDFCLRLARRVRARAPHIRIVHYVAPSVWAWRPGRAQRMAGVVDQVLALLPFEPPYMEAVGIRCDFVGHPAMATPLAPASEVASWRQQQGIAGPLLLLLPGSRRSEIRHLLPVFRAVMEQTRAVQPDLHYALLAAPAVAADLRAATALWPDPPPLIEPQTEAQKMTVFQAADLALAASGSVSLELARAGTPMVIAYDMARLSRLVLSRMLRTDTVTLVNLITGTRTVPEFIAENCRSDLITQEILHQLHHPGQQVAALRATVSALAAAGDDPGLSAARAVLDGLNPRP